MDIEHPAHRHEAIQTLAHLFALTWLWSTGVRVWLCIGVALELLGVGLGVMGPFALKAVIDTLSAGNASFMALTGYVALFICSWAGSSLISSGRMVFSSRVVDGLASALGTAVVSEQLPRAASVRAGDSGRTLGQIERLPFSLAVVFDGVVWHVAPLALQVAVSLWLLAATIPAGYSLILVAVLLTYAIAAWWGATQHQKLAGFANIAAVRLSQQNGDILRNARRVVFNGALDLEVETLRGAFAEKAKLNSSMMWSLLRMSSIQFVVIGGGLFWLLAMGLTDTLAHRMSVGDFVLLQAYAFRLAAPLSGVGFILSQSSAALVNIRDVLDLAASTKDDGIGSPKSTGPVVLSVRNLAFSYGPGLPELKGISFDLAPASFNVIVGANGSGKSTLAQLLAGTLESASGKVELNALDLHALRRQDRHTQVLYVPQFVGMFNRTLAANALYPPTRQTQTGLIALLKRWRFYADERPVDLDASIGEQGERLSGGQIQKLELARIAGVRVPVVILDESTSALDAASEDAILRDLRHRFAGKTTLIVITHRRELAEIADCVLFMKAGRLLEVARHRDLIDASDEYAELWRT